MTHSDKTNTHKQPATLEKELYQPVEASWMISPVYPFSFLSEATIILSSFSKKYLNKFLLLISIFFNKILLVFLL